MMKRKEYLKYLNIIFIILFSYNIFSQQDIYLSAERKSSLTRRVYEQTKFLPWSISIVSREDIDITNSNQTTDILNQLPGLFITRTSAFGRADVNIRGIGDQGRQIGVFIDGRPDKMSIFSCSVTHTLPLNNVERIEVIRGPESVIYGQEAFGGAINIITRRARKKLEGSLFLSAGSFNTSNSRLQFGSKQELVDFFISYDQKNTDGHTINSEYNSKDFTGQVGYSLGQNSDIFFSGKIFSGKKNEPSPSPSGTWNNYERGSWDVTYRNLWFELLNSTIKLYRSFGEHKFSDGWHSKDYTDGLMVYGNTVISSVNEISFGMDYRLQVGEILNTMPIRFVGKYNKYEYGLYIDDKHTFFKKLTLNAGIRYNYDEYAKESLTPRAGVVYNFSDNTILRGLWSQGFRAPHINDLFLWSGNKDLKPEKVINTEFGIRQKVISKIFVDISGFAMNGNDLIEVVAGKKQNIGKFEFKGIESIISGMLTESLSFQTNYTYFDPGTKTRGRPGDKIVCSLKYSKKGFDSLISSEYVGRYYADNSSTKKIDDYLVINTKVNYEIISGLNLFFAVDNVTDIEYKIYNSGLYTMPRRSFSLGVNYRL